MINTNIDVVTTTKFETAALGCFLRLPLTKHNLAYASLLAKMQENGSLYYPNSEVQDKRLLELYDLHLEIAPEIFGQEIILSYLANFAEPTAILDPDYTQTEIVETLVDIISHPLISQSLLTLSQKQLQQELQETLLEPENLALAKFFQAWYDDRPEYQDSFVGDLAEISAATTQSLRLFATNLRIVPAQILAISSSASLQEQLEKTFRGAGFLKTFVDHDLNIPARTSLVEPAERQNLTQSQLLLGYAFAGKQTLKEQLVGSFLAQYLTRNNKSRLFAAIREDLGASYAINATNYGNNSLFLLSMGLADKNLNQARQIVLQELTAIRQGQVDLTLFKQIKQVMLADLLVEEDSLNWQLWQQLRGKLISGYQALDQKATLKRLRPEELTRFVNKLELKESYTLR